METESRTALESLVVDNPDLERLEQLLGQFNIFEAIGAVRHELRHSDFLSFLLDPRQNHGLGDDFVRLFLQKVLASAESHQNPISLVDLDIWNLNEIEVFREWQNIDILLVENSLKFVVIIENKIGSSEHSNQLQRYRQNIAQRYPDWKLISIFLTPDGDAPTDDFYITADYTTVCGIVERLTEKRASTIGADVRTLMNHYGQMLRRHIVSESEIAELCRRIYSKHRLALDLIFEHRPDQQVEISEILKTLVGNDSDLQLDTCSKSCIRFAPAEWYVSKLTQGQGWTPSGQMLLFEFSNRADKLSLVLYIGPGPEKIRQELFTLAQANTPLFRTQSKSLNQKWNSIYSKKILQMKDYEDEQSENLEPKIKEAWRNFQQNDLLKIKQTVRANFIN